MALRPTNSGQRRGVLALAAIIIGALVIWLGVLPQVARLPAVRQRNAHFSARGIDPAAFFYTDHPAAETWNRRVERALTSDPEAFGLRRGVRMIDR